MLTVGAAQIQKAFRHDVRDTGAEEGSRDLRVGRGHLGSSLCNNTQNLVPELKRKQQESSTPTYKAREKEDTQPGTEMSSTRAVTRREK